MATIRNTNDKEFHWIESPLIKSWLPVVQVTKAEQLHTSDEGMLNNITFQNKII